MIIVIAFLVAHLLDKSFYTLRDSSSDADQTAAAFFLTMRLFFWVLMIFSLASMSRIISSEPYLTYRGWVWTMHIVAMFFLAVF